MEISKDTTVLNDTQLHKTAVVKLSYSPSGNKLAAASLDKTISLLRMPIFGNKLNVSSL
jgi:WD40 repeat protein